ncbi:MAG: NgoFVII family restriction endonuclease [Halobacteria archaeon]
MLWFRIAPEDVIEGQYTDAIGLYKLLSKIKKESPDTQIILKTAVRLHAKIYATNERAYIASANLSSPGFSLNKDNRNVEIGMRLESVVDVRELWSFIEKAESEMEDLPKQALASIAKVLMASDVQKEIHAISQRIRSTQEKLKKSFEMPHHHIPLR